MNTSSSTSSTNTTKNKSSVSETGNAKNVANFQVLIEFVTGYESIYNPSKNALKLPQLIDLKQQADASLVDLLTKNTNFNNKVNERSIAFSGLKSFTTRLINALQVSEATPETINNARTFNRKIQGKKASNNTNSTNSDDAVPNTISTSQQSYDQLIQHLSGIKSVLEAEPSYSPNESDLQIANIQSKISDLIAKNTAVSTAYTTVSNSRIVRNQILYANTTGLVAVAQDVKNYVKSLFGASSPQFAQVKGIKFTNKKI